MSRHSSQAAAAGRRFWTAAGAGTAPQTLMLLACESCIQAAKQTDVCAVVTCFDAPITTAPVLNANTSKRLT